MMAAANPCRHPRAEIHRGGVTPVRAHEPVHARTPLSHAHDERWVEMFCDTIDFAFQGPQAEIAKGRGRTIAAAMDRLLSGVSASGMAPVEPMWRRVENA